MHLPEAERHYVPFSVRILNKIAVTDSLNNTGSFVSVGKNRICRVILKSSPGRIGASIGYHVTVFRASLGRHKIVIITNPIHMRAFKKTSAAAFPDTLCVRQLFACFNIYFTLNNSALTVIVSTVAEEVNLAPVEQQGGVNAVPVNLYRLRPFAVNVVCPDVKVFVSGIVGGHHIESAVVVPNSGSENASRAVYFFKSHL